MKAPACEGRTDAHVHSTVFSPDGRYLFVQDLGADKICGYRYTVDGSRGLISPTDTRHAGEGGPARATWCSAPTAGTHT